MGGSYTNDEQSAAKLAGLIADTPTKITAGTVTATTTTTTTVAVTHGLGATPDFVIATRDKADVAALAWAEVSTTGIVTFTGTTATSWSVSYIMGVTA